jgi:galactose mutarotase-like enzyme
MNFSHREDKSGDRLLDILTDEANGVRIAVSRLGAELVSLARRNSSGEWIGFLYRDNDLTQPQKGWGNHATVMGYYLHRLKNGHSSYRGREIRGGTHGFLRSTNWHPVADAASEGALAYQVAPDDYKPSDYPLKVGLELRYQLKDGSLTVRFQFTNYEPELEAHVGFGLHPGLGATSFESFQFLMPVGKYRRIFSRVKYRILILAVAKCPLLESNSPGPTSSNWWMCPNASSFTAIPPAVVRLRSIFLRCHT